MTASPATNPFASRFVRPGAIPFLFEGGDSLMRLLDRLEEANFSGQIVGPHGSGKSTLLATLEKALERRDFRSVRIELHDGKRRLPAGWKQRIPSCDRVVLLVDGYEQLSRLSRFALRRFCHRRGTRLVATVHADVGMAMLYRTSVSEELAQRVVVELAGDDLVTCEDIRAALEATGGDLRETLFALYDRVEERLARRTRSDQDRPPSQVSSHVQGPD